MESLGRREASKQATRAALRAAAARLFRVQGFEATTIPQIARAAGVGERTFYRYFDGKDDLLADQVGSWFEQVQLAIRERPADEPPYTAVSRALMDVAGKLGSGSGLGDGEVVLPMGRPLALLQQAAPRPLRRIEEAIAAALVDRLPDDDPDTAQRRAGLLARVAVTVLRDAMIRRRAQAAAGIEPGSVQQLMREAFADLPSLVGDSGDAARRVRRHP